MSDNPWLKSYPKNVPLEIDADSYASIVELFEKSCQKFPENVSYHNMGKDMTYAELEKLSGYFAAYLQSLGLKKGDRIAIQMPNLLQYPVCMFGALRAGLVVVNTNPLYTEREMEHQFRDSGISAIVILTHFCDKLENVLKKYPVKHVITTSVGDLLGFPKNVLVNLALRYVKKAVPSYHISTSTSFSKALIKGMLATRRKVEIDGNDIAFLQYTGGTTGVSKGAMLTHRNMIANLQQIAAWMSPVIRDSEEVVITALPLYHIFSLTVNCLNFMKVGANNILITNPKDMGAFVKELSKHKFSVVTGVNTLFNGLLHHPDFENLDFSHLKVTVGGGMAVQTAVAEHWKKVTGNPLVEGYGLTEASPVLCVNRLDGYEMPGTIGLPMPSTQIALFDEEGKEVAQGERGELCAKGPQVMKGYWNRPDETGNTITKDGWLKTGDVGVMDSDGYFKIVDRIKDMILVSGFNVYPNEIEEVISQHPGVLEVAAVGVQDDKSGEAIKLFIVKKNEGLTAQTIKEFAREKLTGYKRPKFVEFRKELPKSNVGKILRRLLKEEVPNNG
ncbi:AMP-binding protein [bacterium]|nr:AMP-binding protein [bacterium]